MAMATDGRTGSGRTLLTLSALLLTGLPPPAAAQLLVQPTGSSCPTNALFLGSFDDDQMAYAPYSAVYLGVVEDASGSPLTRYRHELGLADLSLYTSQKSGSAVTVWYVGRGNEPASDRPALPAAGRVLAEDAASPRAYIRSTPSDSVQSPWDATWQVWNGDAWQEKRVPFPGRNASGSCASLLRVSCVGEAWRCPAGRLHVSGMSVGGETDTVPTMLAGRLLGAGQPAFSKQFVADDGPGESVDAPFPMSPDGGTDRQRLGTFLLTDGTHVNRPVYRHAGTRSSTFLYFDRLLTQDGTQLPLWIVGPEPSRVDLAESRLFFAVDAARRPEEITGCWQYVAAGRQLAAHLNATCENGRETSQPLGGADCRFELPGACGYRATSGQLTQMPYTADQQRMARKAGDAAPGAFFAQLTSDEGKADVISLPFSPAVNSCVSLQYRMLTDAFFGATFSLVTEADGVRDVMRTMFSAERDWVHVAHDVSPGRYRLHVRTTDLSEGDALLLDSVRAVPGNCSEAGTGTPCDHRPCANLGTCVPTGDKTYTCLCLQGYQDRNCQEARQCPPPPPVKHGRPLSIPTVGGALHTAPYECEADFELAEPLARSVATCRVGEWRGVPSCQSSSGSPAEVGPGGGATGSAPPAALTTAAALVAAAVTRAVLVST